MHHSVAVLATLAAVTAVAAAVRSTWSPCGLSMLSTITPIGERGRNHRYRATATWFVVGAVAGGAVLGGLMALLAAGARLVGLPGPTALSSATVAAAVAAASDSRLFGRRLPVIRRQVNERWLDRYRSWVYGAGFGWQIGVGLTTYIMTAGVYLTIVLAALTASPLVALAVGTLFGLVRGLAVLLGRGLTTPEALTRFHRRFDSLGPRVRVAVTVLEAAVALAAAGALGLPALLVLASAIAVAGFSLWWRRGHRHGLRRPLPARDGVAA